MAERRKLESNGTTDSDDDSYLTDRNLSLMEKFRRIKDHKQAGKNPRTKYFFRSFIVWQIPTEIYVFHRHIIPYYMDGYDPMTIYYAKVISFYIGLMLVVNWLCVILYDTSFKKTKDRPLLPVANNNGKGHEYFVARIQEATSNGVGDHCVYDMQADTDGLPWDYCKKCEMHVPYRTRHCSICKKCIMKKDHHCYITACCIGFKNQRYFVVLTLYVILAGIFGGAITIKYVRDVVWVDLYSLLDFVFPIPVFRWMFGSLRGLHCLIIIQIYVEILFGLICVGFFSAQIYIITKGITLSEEVNKVRIRNTNTLKNKLRSIFGDFWFLNFLFPMTLIFRQSDDGIRWEGVRLANKPAQNFSKQQ